MGWLFGKKKVPKVPMPEPHAFNENTLQFPSSKGGDKVIQPDKVKEAAGIVEEPTTPEIRAPPQMVQAPLDNTPRQPVQPAPQQMAAPIVIHRTQSKPLYVGVGIYQRILGEIVNLKSDLAALGIAHQMLESSEFNEEQRFEKMRKAIKSMHDNIVQVDKVLFKGLGE